MLSQLEQKLVEKYVRLSTKYYCYPFDWNSSENQLETTKSKFKYIAALLHFLYTILYTSFLILRLIPGYGYSPSIVSQFSHVAIFHFFFLAVCVFHFSFQLSAFMYTDETVFFYNQVVDFNSNAGLKYLGTKYLKPGSLRERAFNFFDKWLSLLGTILALAFLAMPNNPHYMYSALPSNWHSIYTFLPFLAMETFYAVTAVIFYVYATLIAFLYLISTNFWLKRACDQWLTSPVIYPNQFEIEENPTPEDIQLNIIHVHRCLTLLNSLFNRTFGYFALPMFKSACEVCMIVCLYGMIRMFGKVEAKVYVFLPGLGIVLLIEHALAVALMANIHDISSGLKKNAEAFQASHGFLTRKSESVTIAKLFSFQRKCLWSCRPLRCKMGSVYFIEKSTKIDLSGMIIDSILFLLISF